MTFFAQIESLETRALALTHMRDMLRAMHETHLQLHRWSHGEPLWKRVTGKAEGKNREAHIRAACEAGFMEQHFATGKYRLTDKGRAAIGAPKPFWDAA